MLGHEEPLHIIEDQIPEKALALTRICLFLALFLPALLVMPGISHTYTIPKLFFFLLSVQVAILLCFLIPKNYLRSLRSIVQDPITIFLLLFFGVSLLSGILGLHPWRSFSGTLIRGTGLIMTGYLILFFGVLRIILKKPLDWIWGARVIIFGSIIIAGIGLVQSVFPGKILDFKNSFSPISLLGNQGYLSQYLLVCFFLTLWLFHQSSRRSEKAILLVISVVQLSSLLATGIRGTFLGLLLGLSIVVLRLLWKKKASLWLQKKHLLLSLFFGMMVIGSGLQFLTGISGDNTLKKNLQRLTQFSFDQSTFQTRWLNAKVALQAFQQYPIFGVGPENYELAFYHHYDPIFLRYGLRETQIDRAHNALLQILVETGIIGAILIIFFVGYILFKSFSDPVLFSLFLAFFFSSLFEVENIALLIIIFFSLALLSFSSRSTFPAPLIKNHLKSRFTIIAKSIMGWMAFTAVILAIITHFMTTMGQIMMSRANLQFLEKGINVPAFQELFDKGYWLTIMNPYARAEGVAEAVDTLTTTIVKFSVRPDSPDIFSYLIPKLEKARDLFPQEMRYLLFLSKGMSEWALIDGEKTEKARSLLETGVKAYPSYQSFYFAFFNFIVSQHGPDAENEGVTILKKVIALEPQASFPHWSLGKVYLFQGKKTEGIDEIKKAVALGLSVQTVPDLLSIVDILTKEKEMELVNMLYQTAISMAPYNAVLHSKLAMSYLLIDRIDDAKKAAAKALFLDPSLAPQSKGFYELLKEKE